MADTHAIKAFLKEFPGRDWRCKDVTDLGENPDDRMGCEICGTLIRFVHSMVHHVDTRNLLVGCVCAGLISNNIQEAKGREREAHNKATRRRTWLTRKWKVSQKGNPYLKLNGSYLVVFPSKWGGWCYSRNGSFSSQSYETIQATKLALFDAIYN